MATTQEARISSMATQTVDDVPLFRQSPEPSTPTGSPSSGTIAGAPTPSNRPPTVGGGSSPATHEFLNEEPKCSYCAGCMTESPLRKVVSHIFGRNKLSTRQIPKNVWVYYCRKHYQRSRYRNPRGFARQQVQLVRRQCERLEQWGGVRQWVIKVRRREELRMNREGDNVEDNDIEDAEGDDGAAVVDDVMDGNNEPVVSGGSSRRSSTATPTRRRSSAGGGSSWLMKYTGPERTIQDVYKLLDKIEIEVQQNGGKFPDVELLPNVDLALAVPIGVSKKPRSDGDTGDDDGGQGAAGAQSGGSPRSRKRHRAPTDGSTRDNNSGMASKKARGSDKRGGAADKERPSDADSSYSISPRTPIPTSAGPFTQHGYEYHSSSLAGDTSNSPSSDDSHNSLSWERNANASPFPPHYHHNHNHHNHHRGEYMMRSWASLHKQQSTPSGPQQLVLRTFGGPLTAV